MIPNIRRSYWLDRWHWPVITRMNLRVQVELNVRRLRKAAGLSQEELAHRAHLDRTYISGVERGVRNPTVVVLQELAAVLGVRAAELLAEVDG